MLFERIRPFCQTLRFQLTLWNTLLILALLLANFVAIREGVRWTLSQIVNEFLKEELASAVEEIEGAMEDPEEQPGELYETLDQQALRHPRRQLFVQLQGSQEVPPWSSKQSPTLEQLPYQVVATNVPKTSGDYRFVCQEVHVRGRGTATVRVGCSLRRARSDMGRLTNRMLEVGLVLLLLAPAGGYLLAWRATRPLAQIIATTNRLDPTHLEERLPIRGNRDELDRLSRTINTFLDRIADFVRQSRDLTANAAHELRSPLAALESSLEVALNADRTIDEYKEVLAVLLEECERMRVLVNQLLLLAEGDAGRLRVHPKPVRLDQLILNSLEMFRAVAEIAGVELIATRVDPALIQGDGASLWQVANNLLDNAIKFTPAGGRIELSLTLDPRTSRAVFEVADTGIGIPTDEMPHVFERFHRGNKARDREASSRGVGLGLSICRAVVAAHEGTIGVVSTIGKGTTFMVQFASCQCPE